MAEIFVERKNDDGAWVARRNKQVIARGDTQAKTAEKAHKMYPEDRIFGERVRETEGGSPDKWRVLY
jgi:hypothetical protein